MSESGPAPGREHAPGRRSGLHDRYGEFMGTWRTLSLYERFEQAIALVLTGVIVVIVLLATFDLIKDVLLLVWDGSVNHLDHRVFQAIFSQIMILLIALEFKHSIIKVVAHRENIIQVETVLLIAILAIARKFIILDAEQYSPQTILALAAVAATLSVAYWLIRAPGSKKKSRKETLG
jgi:uncharacterized membrane protein (DUF373 family)